MKTFHFKIFFNILLAIRRYNQQSVSMTRPPTPFDPKIQSTDFLVPKIWLPSVGIRVNLLASNVKDASEHHERH